METAEISSRCDFALWAIERTQEIDLDRPGIAIGVDRRAFVPSLAALQAAPLYFLAKIV